MSTLRAMVMCLLAAMLGGCPERYTRVVESPRSPGRPESVECVRDPCAGTSCPSGRCTSDDRCQPHCDLKPQPNDPPF